MDKKIIINIGRQLGSGGRDIAKMLSDSLGCKFYDKELLDLAARESGFCKKFFEQNDEKKGFFKSLFSAHTPFVGENDFYRNNFSQESLFQFQSDAIVKAAQQGSCVFVGRCADYVLRNFTNVTNVFITADLEQRIETVCRRKGCDKDTAMKIIEDRESTRSSYYNYYTGKDWGHSSFYHLCVNSSVLGLEGTAMMIEEFIQKRYK